MYFRLRRRRICGIVTSIFILTKIFRCPSLASRAYPNGCTNQPTNYYDYDSFSLSPTDPLIRSHDDFLIIRRLGVGKFSDVFEAVDISSEKSFPLKNDDTSEQILANINPKTLCVIKCLKPVSERKVKRELLVLSHTQNLPNMVRLLGVVLTDPSVLVHSSSTCDQNGKEESAVFATKIHEMPSFVFNHAGHNSRWLCHGVGVDSSVVPSIECSSSDLNTRHDSDAPFHLTEYEIKYYLCHLLIALDSLHSMGIMHRDVKPRNILINRAWPVQTHDISKKNRPNTLHEVTLSTDFPFYLQSLQESKVDYCRNVSPLVLIDFGLADFYFPNKSYNVRVASRHYKAPELLLGYEYYDYGIDIWGVGCILAGLLFRREPFFRGRDNTDQLGKIVSVLGSADLMKYCEKYGIKITPHVESIVATYDVKGESHEKRKSWLTFLEKAYDRNYGSKQICPIPSITAIDLLDQLLVYDHEKRLTAKEALMHPFFHEVIERAQSEVRKQMMSSGSDENKKS